MNNLVKINDSEFSAFLVQHSLKRLSGTTVLSLDQIAAIRSSIIYVLQHAQTGKSISEQFEDGKKQIVKKMDEIRELYQKIIVSYQSFGIESMEITINEFDHFFATYDVEYAANQEGEIWIDYQLANPIDTITVFGIDFVYEYLFSLYQEVSFINLFPKSIIQEALMYYQKQLKFDYRKDINNLYEVIFNQAAAKLFTNSNQKIGMEQDLILTRDELNYLYSNQHLISNNSYIQQSFQSNHYYQLSLQKFQLKLQMISKWQDLANFLLCEPLKQEITIELKAPMVAEKYVELSEKIISEPEKACVYITNDVDSPYDLLEIIETELLDIRLYDELFKEISFELFAGFLLLLKQRNFSKVDSVMSLLKTINETAFAVGVEKRVQNMKEAEIIELDDLLLTVELENIDFS